MRKITLIDISRLDANLATTFLALWQERSVSKAAARLSLSQSAVSAALTRLRDAAGDPLFVRTRGGMRPTPRAIAMAEPLETAMALIRDAFHIPAAFDPASSRQHFSLGMSDDFELAIGPALFRRLLAEAPQVSVVFRQANRHTVEAMLEAREIDIALIARPQGRSWLAGEVVGASGYACLLDPAACGVGLPLSLDDYLALPHVLVSFSGREGAVDDGLRAIGRSRRVHTALTHFSAVPPFLRGMRAVTTIPSHAAAALAAATGLALCPPPIDLGRYAVSTVWRRDTDSDPGSAWMRGLIRDACRAIFSPVV